MMPQSFTSTICTACAVGLAGSGVHSYTVHPRGQPIISSITSIRQWRLQHLLHPRRAGALGWQRTSIRLSSGSFYDDFEDFSDFGSGDSSGDAGDKSKGDDDAAAKASSGGDGDGGVGDDAVMRELRERMNDLSRQKDDTYDDEDEDEEDDDDDMDSGSALPDLEGNTLSSIDDLIGFAQAKARAKAKETAGSEAPVAGGTWEDENWAREVPRVDAETGEPLDFDDILEGGVVLIANPAKFCSDLADEPSKGNKEGGGILGGLFDDPFPSASKAESNSISPALLAKFGITLPPSPDLGPDRRADLLPVVLLVDRDPVRGCQAVLMNRRTGNLMGDLPPSLFDPPEDDNGGNGNGFASHPLSAFMIQPLWWAGSSPGGQGMGDEATSPNRGGGVKAIDMVHACPYVNGSVPLPQSEGLYWGGNPVQAQEAMKQGEKPLSGFDFKFFIQSTRWIPSQLEREIEDGTWYLATVSKEVLFRSRDRLGAKRAKPLWTEIVELLGDDYKHIRDQLYGEDEE